MSSKPDKARKNEPAAPVETVISKAAEKHKSVSTNQAQSAANEEERQQKIAMAAYYLAARRGFDGGYEEQDWLEAEAEIDGVSQPGGF